MGYDNELKDKMDLLERYDSIIRKINEKRVPFRLRRDYNELMRHYESYKNAPLDKSYLRAANPVFSKRLDDFEKLIGGEK